MGSLKRLQKEIILYLEPLIAPRYKRIGLWTSKESMSRKAYYYISVTDKSVKAKAFKSKNFVQYEQVSDHRCGQGNQVGIVGRLRVSPDRAAEPEPVGTGQSGSYVVPLRSSSSQPLTAMQKERREACLVEEGHHLRNK